MRIVVLSDGETFSDAAGCRILDVNDSASTEEIEAALGDLETIMASGGGYVFGPGEVLEQHIGYFEDDGALVLTDLGDLVV